MKSIHKMTIYIVLTLLFLLLVSYIFITGPITTGEVNTEPNQYNTYSLSDDEPLLMKGKSIISDSQNIAVDYSNGDIAEVLVSDGEFIEKEKLLITYVNNDIVEELEILDQRMEKLEQENEELQQEMATYEKNRKEKVEIRKNKEESIEKLEERLEKKEAELQKELEAPLEEPMENSDSEDGEENNISDTANLEQEMEDIHHQLSEINDEVIELTEDITLLQSQLENSELTMETNEDSMDEFEFQKSSLENKKTTEVYSSIDGRVTINPTGKTDPSVDFITIISETPLVRGEVSEYYYEQLSVGDSVELTVNVNDQTIDGTIIEISNYPMEEQLHQNSSSYEFFVRPTDPIQFGYNVEITLSNNEFRIPKSVVSVEGDDYFVWVLEDNNPVKTEIDPEESGDFYWVDGNTIDKSKELVIDPENTDLVESND